MLYVRLQKVYGVWQLASRCPALLAQGLGGAHINE